MAEWQRKAGDWPALRHPLVYSIPYMEVENALLNRRLKDKREHVAKAIRERKWGTVIMLHERPYRAQN